MNNTGGSVAVTNIRATGTQISAGNAATTNTTGITSAVSSSGIAGQLNWAFSGGTFVGNAFTPIFTGNQFGGGSVGNRVSRHMLGTWWIKL
jgi:hypothetical protein